MKNNNPKERLFFERDFIDFSLRLLKHTMTDKGNVIISPLSIAIALTMLSEGSSSSTRREFKNLLAKNSGLLCFQETLSDLCRDYANNNQDMLLANSLWANTLADRCRIIEGFQALIKDKYNADVFQVAFGNGTAKDINNWISNRTDHQINDIVSNMDENVVSLLVNAVCFNQIWDVEYCEKDIVKNGRFFGTDGVGYVDYMFSKEDIFLQTDIAEGFIKPYTSKVFGYFALKPREDNTIEDIIKLLLLEPFENVVQVRRICNLYVGIPEYSQDSSIELRNQLVNMGLVSCFTNGDFSKMLKGDFSVGEILHRCQIEVNHHGTNASAATIVEIEYGSMLTPEIEPPKQIVLDRPFLYGVIDMKHRMPVFIGVFFHSC